MKKRTIIVTIVILVVIFCDQFFKIWVKTHMPFGSEIPIMGDWFRLHFTENPGIAFGLEFGGRTGKIFLTLFRLLAVILIGYYLVKVIKAELPVGFCVSMALIFIGAIGNIVDSLFYGIIFKYDTFFHGRVVDMLYFPVIQTHYPQWFPIWAGNEFIFFRPVFNLSDTAITIGVFSILLFYSKTLKRI